MREEVVNKHVSALRSAGLNPSDFKIAFEDLKGDKSARVNEIKEIRRRYTGKTSAIRRKDTGINDIRSFFDTEWKKENR